MRSKTYVSFSNGRMLHNAVLYFFWINVLSSSDDELLDSTNNRDETFTIHHRNVTENGRYIFSSRSISE